jgi:hypothetical protein
MGRGSEKNSKDEFGGECLWLFSSRKTARDHQTTSVCTKRKIAEIRVTALLRLLARVWEPRNIGTNVSEIWCWGDCTKICRNISMFVKTGQYWRTLYLNTYMHFGEYLYRDKLNVYRNEKHFEKKS